MVVRNGDNALQPAAEVDVLLGQEAEGAVGVLYILHKHRVADFEEAATVAVGVALWAKFYIVLDVGELVEDLRVGAARLARGHLFRSACPCPPIFLTVKTDSFLGNA